MPFISIEFVIFFALFFPLYWSLKFSPRLQNILLLIVGLLALTYINYIFVVSLIVFSLFISGISYIILNTYKLLYKKIWLIIGIVVSLLNLSFYKYYDLLRPSLQMITHYELLDMMLPLGISYYTFQAISYLVSITSFGHDPKSIHSTIMVKLKWYELLMYLSFFPTITSGPIFRADKVKDIDGYSLGASSQIKTTFKRTIIRPELAIALILLGIFKKWCLSGLLGNNVVDPVFENPMQYSSFDVLSAIYGYTLQLFFDFSGYTDLVIGIAMLLGFQLPQNFKMPLRAFNIRDFWNRWHITLSTWIRDYIYIPLGGNKRGFVKTQFNLLIAMVLSGIWHGYGWNFFIWGLIHGSALVLLNIGDAVFGGKNLLSSTKIGRFIAIFVTFNFVCFAFVIFHTNSIENAELVFKALITNTTFGIPNVFTILVLSLTAIFIIFYPFFNHCFKLFVTFLYILPIWLWAVPIVLLFIVIMILAPSGIPGFIYANF